MKIDINNAASVSGFYIVGLHEFTQTLVESEITHKFDFGPAAVLHGTRNGQPIWFLDVAEGSERGIWVEDSNG